MPIRKRFLIPALIVLISSALSMKLTGQITDKLPRSIPESEGVSSSGIIDFLNAIDSGRQEIHSFMFLRHGKVIAEGWWNPYGPDYKHLLYSASKTFTATAIKSDKGLPVNSASYNELQKRQANIMIEPSSFQSGNSEFESKISGREFMLDNNDYGIQSVYFAFGDEECSYGIKRDGRVSLIRAGLGAWKINNSELTSLLVPPRNTPVRSIDANYSVPQSTVKAGACYSWADNNTLEITARFVEENLGSQTVVCRFSEINGTIRVTLSPKAPQFPGGFAGRTQPALQLRGTLVNIK